jgi:hypothetical protein
MSLNTCGGCGATYPSGTDHTCPSTIRLESDPFTPERVPCKCKSATTGAESTLPVWQRIEAYCPTSEPWTQADVDNLRDVQGYPPAWASADAMVAEAMRVTSTDRNETYDDPERNFANIALGWTALGRARGILKDGAAFNAGDVARFDNVKKLVRDSFKPKRDNRVDLVGNTRCLERAEPTDG